MPREFTGRSLCLENSGGRKEPFNKDKWTSQSFPKYSMIKFRFKILSGSYRGIIDISINWNTGKRYPDSGYLQKNQFKSVSSARLAASAEALLLEARAYTIKDSWKYLPLFRAITWEYHLKPALLSERIIEGLRR